MRVDIAFEYGEGSYLYDTNGEKYLDFATGIATNSLGHCHPHLVAALQEQASKLWHVSNLYNIPEQQRFANRLAENSFADTVFFCNSGAEAMEGCLKVARKYHFENGEPEREEIVCATGAFHGRTLTTLSAGDSEKYREGFGGVIDGIISCGDCAVKPGDLIIGDDDGISVVQLDKEEQLLKSALKKLDEEEITMSEIEAGTLPYMRLDLKVEDI